MTGLVCVVCGGPVGGAHVAGCPYSPERQRAEPEVIGWPPNRATVMAVSAFVANQRLVLARVRMGERITLTQRNKPVAMLVPIASKDGAA